MMGPVGQQVAFIIIICGALAFVLGKCMGT